MKAEFLKIAGVKSEAEFYKKFPTEEAFMKKHGKAIKKSIVKAQVGQLIPNKQTPTGNTNPTRIDESFLFDTVAGLTGKKNYEETLKEMQSKAQVASGQQQSGGGGGMSGMMSMLPQLMSMFGGAGGEGGAGGSSGGTSASDVMSGLGDMGFGKNGGKFSPHMMYDPKTKKGKKAMTYKEHLALKKKGWGHDAPKAMFGGGSGGSGGGATTGGGGGFNNFIQGASDVFNSDAVQNFGIPIVSDAFKIADQLKQQKEVEAGAKQNRIVSELALRASKTEPEKIDREYVRPEDFSNTGEEFFPVYGVGTNVLAKHGGMYKAQGGGNFLNNFRAGGPRNLNLKGDDLLGKGEFTYFQPYYESMQEKLEHNRMLNRKNVNSMRALENGGMVSDQGYTPIINVNQQKAFRQGGVLGSNSYLVPKAQVGWLSPGVWSEMSKMQKGKQKIKEDPGSFVRLLAGDPTAAAMFMENGGKTPKAQGGFNAANISYGGGPGAAIGNQLGDMVGFNNDAGSNIGGTIGGTIGSAFGPIGSAVGSFIGSGIGDLVDRSDRRTRIDNERAEKATKEMSYSALGPQVQAGLASHVREGGNVSSNPSMLDTMKMGGELKTLWGGEAEAVSYNPYAGGDSIQFKGNSHDYRDPKTGQTGIGVAYGKDSVANNEAVVEVENEPAQQLRDGGGNENLVVYGDLKIPEEFVSEIGDDRAKGKKFKNYVEELNKDEKKINSKMTKAADLGLESDNTVFGQLERSTADAILKGSDMKLKSIADKKMILADLQSALNDTFDEFEIKGNEFIAKGKVVDDLEREMNNMAKSGIEIKPENRGKFTAWAKEKGMSVSAAANKVMANPDKYSKGVVKMANFAKNFAKNGAGVPKAQSGFETNELGGDDVGMTVEEAIAAGFVLNEETGLYEKSTGETVDPIDSETDALDEVRPGQGRDKDTGLYGNVTQKEYEAAKEANPWFDWENFDPKSDADVRRYQKEFNKRAEEAGSDKRIKVDGDFGEQTSSARFTPAAPGKEPEVEVAKIKEEPTVTETTTIKPPRIPFIPNFLDGDVNNELNPDQLLAEKYAMATNQYIPVPAQGYQPNLRVPYDISLQDAKNDVIAQSRAMQRNPGIQNNPAAAALMAAPTYKALNEINAEEFRANQAMKDMVYSGNQETLNDAKLKNLKIYGEQYDRQQEAVSNTRKENIAILNSISNKYAQNRRNNMLERVYNNMYPSYQFNQQGDANTTGVGGNFSIPGYGITGGIPGLATPGFNGNAGQNVNSAINLGGQLIDYFRNNPIQQRPVEPNYNRMDRAIKKGIDFKNIYDYVEPIDDGSRLAKKGKAVKKNNKNSNILRAIKNL